MENGIEEYDFGPIIVDECCNLNNDTEESVSSPVRTNFVVIARFSDRVCNCKYRRFSVNLHKNGEWSYTFLNGDYLSEEEIALYNREILTAQSYLRAQEDWRRRGRNIGLWDPQNYYNNGAEETVYYNNNTI